MVYVPAPNVLQIEIRGLYGGQKVENVIYFRRGDSIELAEANALLLWIETVFIQALKPLTVAEYSWTEIYATDLTTSTSPTYARVISPAIVGTQVGSGLPGNCACCLSFRSNNRGRSARGRNYVGGLSEPNVTGNLISLTTINNLIAAYELLLGGGTMPAGWEWSILSRVIEGIPRLVGLVQDIVDVLSTDVTVDSQRGRLK